MVSTFTHWVISLVQLLSTFINGILRDGFAIQERTLLLCCEEGEVEYDPRALKNVTVVHVEEEGELTPAYLKQLEKKHRPKQILIEYNGMWSLARLYQEALPDNMPWARS